MLQVAFPLILVTVGTLTYEPESARQLCESLAAAAGAGQSVALGGNFSKRSMGGPSIPADVTITTTKLSKILQYEPTDLTLSVEAGHSWAELCRLLGEHQQMIPLDPPFAESATVGGVIATNGSGPRRRLYGTARDLVIGMKFSTVDGKEVQSGGMVVKNVAGLDMGKLMIGSFGTLAAISTVNFKLTPQPEVEKTSLLDFDSLDAAIAARDKLVRGVLQPSAIDLLNPGAAGQNDCVLAVQYGGNSAVVERYAKEIGGSILEAESQTRFWDAVIRFPQNSLEKFPAGVVVRVSHTLTELAGVMKSLEVPAIARAANGVTYACFDRSGAAVNWVAATQKQPWRSVMEFSPEAEKDSLDLWPAPGDDFGMMKNVKRMFDPRILLNHGRLYRLI
jgi:glycolate oxidase FAD binding subunit